jgi:hypothetical protein
MRQKAYFIIFVVLLLIPAIRGMAQPPGAGGLLGDLFPRILDTRNDAERIRINDSIRSIIDRYVTSDVIFTHRFENLRYLGQILSPDSRIKIITWNLILTDGTNRYFCYFIRKGEKGRENIIFRLEGANMDKAPRTDITYSANNWYGALYYGIQPFKSGKEIYYVVLGLDYGSLLVTRKIIDIVNFTDEGDIIFGKECFIKDNVTKQREVLEYSADGVVTLRFHDKKSIIFDHLVPISQDRQNNPDNYGTDYSFDAYILKKGYWRFVKNVDVKDKQ